MLIARTTVSTSLRLALLSGVWWLVGASVGTADLIRLQSGAEVRGQLIETPTPSNKEEPSPQAASVVLETLTGARIEVAHDEIAFITRRPLAHEQYEVRARQLAETPEAHWELALWCREQRLTDQHRDHCQRTVTLDPTHEAAHRALGHVFKDGAWVDWDEYMTERGYVKHRGRWITQPELDLLQKTAAELEREQAWYPQIRLWTTWITGPHRERAQKGLEAFQELRDVDAAPAILRLMSQHAVRDVRLLAVQVLSQSGGAKSALALSQIVLGEGDDLIRDAALQGIPADQFAHTRGLFIQKLRSTNNDEVNRAGAALARVGDAEAIEPLIHALITAHNYQVRARTGQTYSFGTNGSFGTTPSLPPAIEAGLRTGQFPNGVIVLDTPGPAQNAGTRIVTIRREQQNPHVLATLQRLTGEDFGYDERTWHLWWTAQKHDGGLQKS